MDAKDIETILSGGLAGAIVSVIVNSMIGRWRRWRLHRNIRLELGSRIGTRGTARIYNSYVYPLNSVYVYITIEHQLDDVLDPPEPFESYIGKNNLCKVQEDRLCWSSTAPSSNPPVIDIYPGERQALNIVNIDRDGKWIEIPSEKGWSTSQDAESIRRIKRAGGNDDLKTSRVFLKAHKYRAKIKIVSKDTKAKVFNIEIDPQNQTAPVKVQD